ncbi:MAG: ABC transporter substrate-binding protein [Anaerolineae bacterium]|nr:ABC transporter substrate-binding protein [Anaerolineae bacterium]
MSPKRFWIIITLLAISVLALAACQPTEVIKEVVVTQEVEVVKEVIVTQEVDVIVEVEAPEVPTGTLVRAISTFPNSLDSPQAAERQASTTADQLYDTLVAATAQGTIEPLLAESWEISDDGTEYTFTLREDVVFHNGEPFNADAVLFNWERVVASDFEYAYHWNVATAVEVVDEYTVKATLEEPNVLFLATVADNWSMIPPGYFEEVGQEGFNEHPMGTGPFKFVEWEKGDHITMEANLDYWAGAPKIETLIFRPIPESATRVAAIQTGEVDIVTRLTSEEAQGLMGAENVKVIKYAKARIFYIAFNNLTTGLDQPTMDAKVRQAMNYAIDVDTIIDALFDGFAEPATGYVASGELGYGAVEPFGYDPDKAKELLAEAGYADGFAMEMACPAGAYSHFEEVCETLVGFLGDVGIDVTLEIMESGQYWDLEANKELPPIFGDSWSATGGEAFRRLKGALGGFDASYSAWSDPEIDRLLTEIQATPDQDERAALYGELQVYMQENPPFIYLYQPVAFEAINTRVQDYKPLPAETYDFFPVFLVGE